MNVPKKYCQKIRYLFNDRNLSDKMEEYNINHNTLTEILLVQIRFRLPVIYYCPVKIS
jgi:hypothetical protein